MRGYATQDDCIFRLKTHMQEIAASIAKLEGHIPQSFRTGEGGLHSIKKGDST